MALIGGLLLFSGKGSKFGPPKGGLEGGPIILAYYYFLPWDFFFTPLRGIKNHVRS